MNRIIKITSLFVWLLSVIACNKPELIPQPPIPQPSFGDFSYHYEREGIIKAEIGNNAYYLLTEALSSLETSPGHRTLKKTTLDGMEIMTLGANSDHALIDFCISDQAIFILYSNRENIQIKKYDLQGTLQRTKVIWENTNNSPIATDDRGKIVVHNNSVLVAIRPEDYSTWLYSMSTNALEINWSSLVEPKHDIFPHGMTGGSYDTFEQLAHPYMVFLDIDEGGNAYVAVPALEGSTVYVHNQHFGETLSHIGNTSVSSGFETDALVTKVSKTGDRIYTVVAGSVDPDECYGIKANNTSFYLYGRTGKPTNTVGYEWDAYVARYNSATGSLVFANSYDIDKSEIIYDIALTSAGDLIVTGSQGWTQNPLGYSVSGTARKLVATIGPSGNFKEEFELESGLRHNQVRSIIYRNNRIWIGGWENGPGTHTGDSNPNLVFADAFWESYRFQ